MSVDEYIYKPILGVFLLIPRVLIGLVCDSCAGFRSYIISVLICSYYVEQPVLMQLQGTFRCLVILQHTVSDIRS